jgi:hypothetical protein
MPRDAKITLGRDPMAARPFVSAMRPAQPSAIRKARLMLFDPYSERMIVYAKPGNAPAKPEPRTAPAAAHGPSKALRVLQLALLSSVLMVIVFMLTILQTSG